MSKVTVFDTELQNKIAGLLIDGFEPLEIAKICGCSNPIVYNVLHSAKYAQLAYAGAMQKLISVGAPTAINTLIDIAKDTKAPKQARVSASDKLLQHTGMVINDQGKLEKSPANMTQQELQQRLIELQNEAANRAKPVVDGDSVASLLD